MGRLFSLYLDLLRLLGAVMVLLAHWAFPRFTGTDHLWMRQHDLGGDGVVIFFVLSGLLIAYTADQRRDEGPALFAADRLSRLWSVAIPALIFGALLDMIGHAANADVYSAVGYEGGASLMTLLSSTVFMNEIWFISAQPGSNGPYWSLGYEAWYYAIFAGWFFAPKRWNLWLAASLALVAGPKIWLLAPSWILGVWVWRVIASGTLSSVSRPMAAATAIIPVIAYLWMHTRSFHWHLLDITETLIGAELVQMIGASDTFLWSSVLGCLMALHILGMAALTQSGTNSDAPLPFERSIRWLAGGSFALYLIHFPVMHFAAATIPGAADDVWRQATLLVVPCVVAYMLAELTERRRPALRAWMRSAIQKTKRRRMRATASDA